MTTTEKIIKILKRYIVKDGDIYIIYPLDKKSLINAIVKQIDKREETIIFLEQQDKAKTELINKQLEQIAKLRQDVKDVKGKSIFMELAAFHIEQKLVKRRKLIEAQGELILRLQKQMIFAGFSTPDKMAPELRQRIEQLKSEI